MTRKNGSFVLLVALAVTVTARAEVPLKSKAELQDEASHIVVGKVQSVYSVTSESDDWVNPKQFTQKFRDGQIYRSIYRLAGDYLILCGTRDGGRPSNFACGTDKGGEFLIVLKRQP